MNKARRLWFTLLLMIISLNLAGAQKIPAKEEGVVALTPPMGWNSWDCYGPSVTEDEVKANADYMAKSLARFGWKYVVVDIQWYEPKAGPHGLLQECRADDG